jgi:hypothetical protein
MSITENETQNQTLYQLKNIYDQGNSPGSPDVLDQIIYDSEKIEFLREMDQQ